MIEADNHNEKVVGLFDQIAFVPEEASQWCENRAMERFLDILNRFIDS